MLHRHGSHLRHLSQCDALSPMSPRWGVCVNNCDVGWKKIELVNNCRVHWYRITSKNILQYHPSSSEYTQHRTLLRSLPLSPSLHYLKKTFPHQILPTSKAIINISPPTMTDQIDGLIASREWESLWRMRILWSDGTGLLLTSTE